MSEPLTPEMYQTVIVAHAWAHILAGGGIVAGGTGTDLELPALEETIAKLAQEHFGAAEAKAEFEETLRGVDRATADRIAAAAWLLVGLYGEVGFTFGGAVGRELARSSVRRTATKARKGGKR